jgi:hypothetical protein
LRPLPDSEIEPNTSHLLFKHAIDEAIDLKANEDCGPLDFNKDGLKTTLVEVTNQRDICVEKSREAWVQIGKMASENDGLAQSTLAVMNRSLHDLKVQEQIQLATGKDTITKANMFVRPNGLMLKRRLGVVDKYHGGERSKRIAMSYMKKKQSLKRLEKSQVSGGDEVKIVMCL